MGCTINVLLHLESTTYRPSSLKNPGQSRQLLPSLRYLDEISINHNRRASHSVISGACGLSPIVGALVQCLYTLFNQRVC